MASFKYRLQPLFDQRERALEAAEEATTQRRKQVQQAEKQKEILESEQKHVLYKMVEGRKTLFQPVEGEPLTSSEILRRRLFLTSLAEDLERLKDAIFSQQIAIDEAKEQLAQARAHEAECRRAVEVMEKHRAKLQ